MVAEQLQRLAGLDVRVDGGGGAGRRGGLGWRTRVQWASTSPDGAPRAAQAPLPRRRPGRRLPDRRPGRRVDAACGVTARPRAACAAGPSQVDAGRLLAGAPGGARRCCGRACWTALAPAAGGAGGRPVRRGRAVLGVPRRGGRPGAAVVVRSRATGAPPRTRRTTCGRRERRGRRAGRPALRGRARRDADLVVLDPPRTGAKRRVVAGIVATLRRGASPTSPATRPRWPATSRSSPSRLPPEPLRAFDLFPMTHHVECVALLSSCLDVRDLDVKSTLPSHVPDVTHLARSSAGHPGVSGTDVGRWRRPPMTRRYLPMAQRGQLRCQGHAGGRATRRTRSSGSTRSTGDGLDVRRRCRTASRCCWRTCCAPRTAPNITADDIRALAGWDADAEPEQGDPVHAGARDHAGLHRRAVRRRPRHDARGDGRPRRRRRRRSTRWRRPSWSSTTR